jgi:hypothetical protein
MKALLKELWLLSDVLLALVGNLLMFFLALSLFTCVVIDYTCSINPVTWEPRLHAPNSPR